MTDAELTRLLAIIGAITGTIGTIAGLAAFGWNYYKWRKSERARLRVTVLPNMTTHQPPLRPEEVILVKVTNVGKLTTTLTHLGLDSYKSNPLKRLIRRLGLWKPNRQFLVMASLNLPYVLTPGTEWTGLINKGDADYVSYIQNHPKPWVSVSHSLGEKPLLKRLKMEDD